MQAGELEKMIKTFEIAYVIAKEEMPLDKYPALIELEKKHGVELGTNYRSDKQCAVFIDCIGEELGSHSYKIICQKLNSLVFLPTGPLMRRLSRKRQYLCDISMQALQTKQR